MDESTILCTKTDLFSYLNVFQSNLSVKGLNKTWFAKRGHILDVIQWRIWSLDGISFQSFSFYPIVGSY